MSTLSIKKFLKPSWANILITFLIYPFIYILSEFPILAVIHYATVKESFIFYLLFSFLSSYLIACFLREKLGMYEIKITSFLKPGLRKILLSIVLFFIFPWPILFETHPGGFRWNFVPFNVPFLFFVSVRNIILGLEFYYSFDYVYFLFNLFSPFIIYFFLV